MKLSANQLVEHLATGLAPIYLVSGDEPLLVTEAADSIREAARHAGYLTRELFHIDKSFDWQQLVQASDSLSLFAEQRILELRMPTGRPGTDGSQVLEAYCDRPADDTLLLIITGRLDSSITRSKWYRAIETSGVCITIWPLDVQQLPMWINARMHKVGLQPDQQATMLLAERIEGNLLAADQEIEKLRLLLGEGPVTLDDIEMAVTDSSRFDPFKLIDAALAGDAVRSSRILKGLREEGVYPLPILGAMLGDLRLLTRLTTVRENQGAAAMEQDFAAARMFPKRKPLIKKALSRLKAAQCQRLMCQAARVDRTTKGAATGNPWDELLQLCLGLAGVRQ